MMKPLNFWKHRPGLSARFGVPALAGGASEESQHSTESSRLASSSHALPAKAGTPNLWRRPPFRAVLPLSFALFFSGCATERSQRERAEQNESLARRAQTLTPAIEEKILALNPEHVTEKDIREVLTNAPAPRIINIHGGLLPLDFALKSFAEFVIGMGYPEWRVRNPRTGDYSFTCYESSAKLAGMIAWYYEKDGLRPMLIGHSVGGIQVVKVLHELAAPGLADLAVCNPVTEKMEDRSTITDPLTGQSRRVNGFQICYATAFASGGLGRTIPNHWGMAGKLRKIPDTVEEFTGFYIGMDIFGGDALGFGTGNLYWPTGTARVRNVRLPTLSSHSNVPRAKNILQDPSARDWVNSYTPTDAPLVDAAANQSDARLLYAADVWHSIKKHWVLELQKLARSRRALRQ